jgi:TonB family protein
MDPVAALQKIFAGMPGFGQALSTMVEGSGKGGLVLKTHVEMYMPVLAALSSGNFDPNAAVMEATSEIVELSTAPVDEAIFQLPADYTSASVGDILKSLTAPTATAAETPQRIRVGGNVQANNLVKKVTPVYPALAKQAGVEGTVRFTVIIDREGNVGNLQLVSGHPLLVEAAQEAVRQWQYKPTLLNGQPVEVVTQVDVNFTLQQ